MLVLLLHKRFLGTSEEFIERCKILLHVVRKGKVFLVHVFFVWRAMYDLPRNIFVTLVKLFRGGSLEMSLAII